MARILLVDDDERLTGQLALHLRTLGHECHVARDGRTVVPLLEQHAVDLLILDVMLPGLSGFEVCRRVRAHPEVYKAPILILTAMDGEEEMMHGLAQGAEDYVTKPFQIDNLMGRIDRLLEAHNGSALQDSLTELPGPSSIKLEILRHISSGKAFSVVYCELLQLREFTRRFGTEQRNRALRNFAHCLRSHGDAQFGEAFQTGHMGGGHYVCIVPPESATVFCEGVRDLWQGHLPAFYKSLGASLDASRGSGAKERAETPRLTTLFCIVHRSPRNHLNSREIFETLSHLRMNVGHSEDGGIFQDRRG